MLRLDLPPFDLDQGLYNSKDDQAAMDGNTRALFTEVARISLECVTAHIRGFHYSPVGGLQAMRDLQSWKNVAASLYSADSERRFDEYREAANVLVIEPKDLESFLEDGGYYKSSACSDLLELRSDWKVIKDKLNIAPTHKPQPAAIKSPMGKK